MKGPKRNELYYLKAKALHAKGSGLVSINTDRSDLWHMKMGHIGNKRLKYLSDLNLLGKDTVAPLNFCKPCVLGKSHIVSFEIGQHSTKRSLDYIHADLWGLEKYPTHGREHVREPEQIDPQVETEQEEVLEQPELEIPETVVPNQEQLEDTNLRDYQLVRDRERRQVRPNLKYVSSNLMEFVIDLGQSLESVEPFSYEEAVNCKNSKNWKKAMRGDPFLRQE
ncbi:CCHC-type domain-containing protein [Abeliophyllum distichum]|uniref:CCHC-type domain-containing protein n=1 Tax=Abeliophyllum distichum TaxID=126358 RepID=A0ABD1PUI5_9LAMI